MFDVANPRDSGNERTCAPGAIETARLPKFNGFEERRFKDGADELDYGALPKVPNWVQEGQIPTSSKGEPGHCVFKSGGDITVIGTIPALRAAIPYIAGLYRWRGPRTG